MKAHKASKRSKMGWAVLSVKRWGYITNAVLVVFCLLIAMSPAVAEEASSDISPVPAVEEKMLLSEEISSNSYDFQKMEYDVYAGGIHAVRADMTMDFRKKGRYSMIFGAETRGLLGSLAPWSGTFETRGWALSGRRRVPEIHESIAMWRGEKEIKTYHYGKEEGFKELIKLYNHKKPRVEKTDEKLTNGTTDVISATLEVMEHASDGEPCDGVREVFDGKRRFKLQFHHKRYVMLEKTRYNAYSGPAVECSVEVEPAGGAWYKKPRGWLSIQEQGRSLGTMPTIWMAQVTPNAVVVPVRVRVRTTYGTMFMHLTKYESGDTVLSVR